MTIFHVLKYPIPRWPATLTTFLPEDLANEFTRRTTVVFDDWRETPDYAKVSIVELHKEYDKIYTELLMEYEGPL